MSTGIDGRVIAITGGGSGMGRAMAIDLGSRGAAAAFIDALRIPPTTATLGSVITYAVHPPTATHRQLDDEQLLAAGIQPGMVRISVEIGRAHV